MRLLSLLRKAGWGVGDQALSSLTNFALSVLVAREVGVDEFGAFAIAFATYIIVMNIARAAATEPLMVRYSGEPADVVRRASARAAGSALTIGVLAGIGCAIVALATTGALRGAFSGLAITFPGLMLQDAWRLSFFAAGRGARAFVNDGVWAVLLFGGAVTAGAVGSVEVVTFVMLWGGAATVAALVGIAQTGTLPQPARALAWTREHRDLIPHFMGELLALSGARQVVAYGVGAIAGLAATGALRAAQLLLNPLHVLTQGLRLVAIPDAVRRLKSSSPADGAAHLRAQGMALSVGLGTVAAGIGTVAWLLPTTIGEALLGETWSVAHPLLIPVTISTAFGGVVVGASVGLRALAAASRSRRARTVMSGLQLSGGLIGAVVASAPGAAWGLAGANILGAMIWWTHFTRGMHDHVVAPAVRPVNPEDGGRAVADRRVT